MYDCVVGIRSGKRQKLCTSCVCVSLKGIVFSHVGNQYAYCCALLVLPITKLNSSPSGVLRWRASDSYVSLI